VVPKERKVVDTIDNRNMTPVEIRRPPKGAGIEGIRNHIALSRSVVP